MCVVESVAEGEGWREGKEVKSKGSKVTGEGECAEVLGRETRREGERERRRK